MQNDSDSPRRVKVVLENCSILNNWYVRDYTWEQETRAIKEALAPGKAFGIYLTGRVPRDLRAQPNLCDGTLRALDADSGAPLASVSIRILNSRAGVSGG